MSDFNCNKCGLCCSEIPAYAVLKFGLPLHPRGKGCANQNEDKTCSIYETRPEVCRVKPDANGSFALAESACTYLQKLFDWEKK